MEEIPNVSSLMLRLVRPDTYPGETTLYQMLTAVGYWNLSEKPPDAAELQQELAELLQKRTEVDQWASDPQEAARQSQLAHDKAMAEYTERKARADLFNTYLAALKALETKEEAASLPAGLLCGLQAALISWRPSPRTASPPVLCSGEEFVAHTQAKIDEEIQRVRSAIAILLARRELWEKQRRSIKRKLGPLHDLKPLIDAIAAAHGVT